MKKIHEQDGGNALSKDRTRVLDARPQKPIILKKVRLSVVEGADKGREAVMQKASISIGSLESNDLVLHDPTVSRVHAVVEELPEGYVLRDLGSTNGTFINGVQIREGYLSAGAVIRIGTTDILFSPVEERVEIFKSSSDIFGELRGASTAMREVFGILERVAPTDASVLIQGETGTGKELAARAIHGSSRRAGGPFIVFDCGAATPNLIESELFGHEKGAFTDAVRARPGAFELADRGTIFLDEIGELSPDLQPKLLRALDRHEIKRVGADKVSRTDVRVIAATNKELEKEMKAGRFREDLYYRLSVVSVFMPSLRHRKEDIETLAEHLLSGISGEIGRKITGLSPEAADALRAYQWPGNVRELKNVLGRAAALCGGGRIEAKDLFLMQGKRSGTIEGLSGKSLAEIEKAAIHATLRSVDGNKTEAAKALGIAYSTLYEKMKKYGMRG